MGKIFETAEAARDEALGRIADRFEEKPEFWRALQALPSEEQQQARRDIYKKVTSGFRVDTGRRHKLSGRVGAGTEVPITRPLERPEVEQQWSALESGEIGLEDLGADDAEAMRRIAKRADPEMVGVLETDPSYLSEYQRAFTEYRDWVETDGYYDTSMEDRDRGAFPEGLRKFMGAVLAPGFAVKQWSERSKRVPFGNPDELSQGEIRERAERAAIADMMPQVMGIRTFDDGKELTFGEKLGGLGGELLSFVAATPNKLVFDAGMKVGARGATAAGLKGWQKRLLTYGAGGAAFGAKETLEEPLPANEQDSVKKFGQRLLGSMTKEAALGAVFGEGLHHALAGVGYAWVRTLGLDTPLMKTVREGGAQDFINYFTRLAQRVREGAANSSERKAFEDFSRWAKEQKVDLDALQRGEIGMEYRRLVPREWTEQFPMLRNALPDSVERVQPRSTVPTLERISASSRQTGEVPARPEPKPAEMVEPRALPGAQAANVGATQQPNGSARVNELTSKSEGRHTASMGAVKADIATGDESGHSGEIGDAMRAAREERPAVETPFQRFALQLNEMTELAQGLGKGRYPQILEIVKRNPDVRGVFRAEADNSASGRIELKAGIFEVLNPDEIADAKEEAFDLLYQAWLGEAEASGGAGMSPPSKEVFNSLLENDNGLQGRLRQYENEVLDSARREVAPEREPIQAAKTLSHEIGHWIDFLPEGTMARGNILGRVAGLHGYYKKMLPAKPGTETEPGQLISEKDRAKLRREAMRKAGGDKMKAASDYAELLQAERKARGLITYDEVKGELEDITAWWRLGGDRSQLTDYHKKPEELYADAFSVLINAPHELAKRAPTFYNAWEAYLSRKQVAADYYEKLQRAVREGTAQTRQVKRLRDSLSKESAILTERDARPRQAERWDGFTSAVLREFQPFYRRAKKQGRQQFKQSQSVVSDFLYRATQHELYLTNLNNRIMGPLSEVGVNMEDFDEFLFHNHIVENRYNIANPLGWTAKTSMDRLKEMQHDNSEQFKAMEQAQFTWWKMRREQVIEPLRESGIFPDGLIGKIEQQAFYTPFRSNRGPRRGTEQDIESLLAQYYGKDTGLRIAKQVGQLGEVKSPTNQLMAIDLRLMDFVKREKAKREVIEVMKKTDPKNIMDADTRKVRVRGKIREEPVEVENARVGTLHLMQGGEVKGYYLPKALTVPFNRQSNINSAWYAKALYQANTFQKSLFTQLNPGFWPVAMVRDVFTRYRKMPSGPGDRLRDFALPGVLKDAAGIAKAFPAAWRSVRGEEDADAARVMSRGMVISRRETIGQGNTFKGADIERALIEFDKDPRNFWSKRRGVEKKASQALSFWLSIGQAFERAPKIATMKYLDEHFPQWPEWKKRNFVRQHGGSPDFLQRGRWAAGLDLFFLFHNPAREGWMSEPDAAMDDPKGYMAREAQMLLPRLTFKLAGLGLLGAAGLKALEAMLPWIQGEEELQKMFRAISHYDLVNYDVIPLAWVDRENQKVLYLRLPTDETTRVLVGAAMQPVVEGADLQQVLGYMGGQVPGQHPVIGLLEDWNTYVIQGRNPYDPFLERNIIDENQFDQGHGTEDMLWHTWNEMGGSIIKRVTDTQVRAVPKTDIEKFLELPVVQNIAGRWVKVSNRGVFSRIVKDERVIEAGKLAAGDSDMALQIIDKYVEEKDWSREEAEALLYSPRVQEKARNYLNRVVGRSLGPELEALNSLKSVEERAAALEVILEE